MAKLKQKKPDGLKKPDPPPKIKDVYKSVPEGISFDFESKIDRREITEYVNAKIAYSVLLINSLDINPKYLNYYLEIINKFEDSVSENNFCKK